MPVHDRVPWIDADNKRYSNKKISYPFYKDLRTLFPVIKTRLYRNHQAISGIERRDDRNHWDVATQESFTYHRTTKDGFIIGEYYVPQCSLLKHYEVITIYSLIYIGLSKNRREVEAETIQHWQD